ncbi:hypothetical protein [Vibrio mexicanus]|uniref:hypothetical protein n=1 Tax=Vibrio mexicanus TaxID=1004326 RepID=UPI00069B89A1|nr:hypothetical protein [Vibrio mexicanus]
MDINRITLAMALCGVIASAGCGSDDSSSSGSGSSSPAATPTIETYEVRAIDGYLRNAKVWLDINEDCLHDEQLEPFVMSGKGGIATIDVTGIVEPESYPIVVEAIAGQTVDEDSPQQPISKNLMLTAPPGEKAITPLSTMVQLYIQENAQGVSDPDQLVQIKLEAVTQAAGILGIEPEQVLGDFVATNLVEVAFIARSVVESSVLPDSPESLQQSMQAAQEGESDLEKNLAVISNVIRETIKNTPIDQLATTPPPVSGERPTQDRDLDGVPDELDVFPDDPNEFINTDDDNLGNNADLDDDNDGYADDNDTYPTDASRAGDHDQDGIDSIDDPYPMIVITTVIPMMSTFSMTTQRSGKIPTVMGLAITEIAIQMILTMTVILTTTMRLLPIQQSGWTRILMVLVTMLTLMTTMTGR